MQISAPIRRDFYPSEMIMRVIINRFPPYISRAPRGRIKSPSPPILYISIAIPHHRGGENVTRN